MLRVHSRGWVVVSAMEHQEVASKQSKHLECYTRSGTDCANTFCSALKAMSRPPWAVLDVLSGGVLLPVLHLWNAFPPTAGLSCYLERR